MSKYPPGYIPLTIHSLGGDHSYANGRVNGENGRSSNNAPAKRHGQKPRRGPTRRHDGERGRRNHDE